MVDSKGNFKRLALVGLFASGLMLTTACSKRNQEKKNQLQDAKYLLKATSRLSIPYPVMGIEFDGNAQLVTVRSGRDSLIIYEIDSGNKIDQMPLGFGALRLHSTAFARIFVASNMRQVKIVDLENKKVLNEIDGNSTNMILQGRVLVISRNKQGPIYWDVEQNLQISSFRTFEQFSGYCQSKLHSSESIGVVSSREKETFYEIPGESVLAKYGDFNLTVLPQAKVGSEVVAAKRPKNVIDFYNCENDQKISQVEYHGRTAFSFSSDGRVAMAEQTADQTTLRIISPITGKTIGSFGPIDGTPRSVCWSQDDSLIALAFESNGVQIFECIENGEDNK